LLTSPNRKHNRQFFYKYATEEAAKSILINKTLRFSSPLIFNDPFDVARKLKLPFNSEELNSKFCNELLNQIKNGQRVSAQNPKLRAIVEGLSKLTPDQREEFVRQRKEYLPDWKIEKIESFKKLQEVWQSLLPSCKNRDSDH